LHDGDAPLRAASVPAEPGVWIVIGGDLLLFSLFFVTFAHYRRADPDGYAASQALLGVGTGLLGTLLLLAGSFCVVLGIEHLRREGPRAGARLFGLAALSGSAFLVNKALEWSALFADGVSVYTSEFFMFYFMFTGIHGFHVLLGILVLAHLHTRMRGGEASPDFLILAEAGGVFWHLVDVLWVALFAILYLAS
jgi:nitric oxide reductase NorE protein